MVKFEDVAHLYMGCLLHTPEGIGTLDVYYTPGEFKPQEPAKIGCYGMVQTEWKLSEVKPYLIPFRSMSTEDYGKVFVIQGLPPEFLKEALGLSSLPILSLIVRFGAPTGLLKALELGYDLFDLIKNGEALELPQEDKS